MESDSNQSSHFNLILPYPQQHLIYNKLQDIAALAEKLLEHAKDLLQYCNKSLLQYQKNENNDLRFVHRVGGFGYVDPVNDICTTKITFNL